MVFGLGFFCVCFSVFFGFGLVLGGFLVVKFFGGLFLVLFWVFGGFFLGWFIFFVVGFFWFCFCFFVRYRRIPRYLKLEMERFIFPSEETPTRTGLTSKLHCQGLA